MEFFVYGARTIIVTSSVELEDIEMFIEFGGESIIATSNEDTGESAIKMKFDHPDNMTDFLRTRRENRMDD